jgi:hypothetical protein
VTEKNAKYWIILAVVSLVLAGLALGGWFPEGEAPVPSAKEANAPQKPTHPWLNQELPQVPRTMLSQELSLDRLDGVLMVTLNCPGCGYVFRNTNWRASITKGLMIIVSAPGVEPGDIGRLLPDLPDCAALVLDRDGVIKEALQVKGAPEYLGFQNGRLIHFSKGGRSITAYLNAK